MAEIQIPKQLQELAQSLGATVPPVVKFNHEKPLKNLRAQFHGGEVDFSDDESEFGCCFGYDDSTFGFHIGFKKLGRALKKAAKVVTKVASVGAFAIPGVGPIADRALRAADKLLGSKKHAKVNQAIINNTKALAALGDPDAIRGAQALAVVSQIRQQRRVLPGKSVIPGASSKTKVNPFIRMTHQLQVHHYAQKKVMNTPPSKKGKWQKFKEWFVGHEVTKKVA